MAADQYHGGCLCGTIRYTADQAPLQVVNCHCAMCRRHSGAAFLTYAAFPSDSVRFLTVAPRRYRSSEAAVRGHCERCGSPIDFVFDADPTLIWLTLGSLDQPELLPPTENWYVSRKLPWIHADADIRSWPELPD